MKNIVVAMIKNEEVFIESSVRYWFTFADQIILFDHSSKDGTMSILQELIAEFGDRLILFNESFAIGVEHKQAAVTNAMVDAAFNQYGADLVIPLDADEFPYLPEGGSLREFFCSLMQNSCYTAFWMPFAPPVNGQIDHSAFVPLSFTRKKCSPMTRWGKSIITRECYYRDNPLLSPGNHVLVGKENGVMLPVIDLTPKLYYAHYVCRGETHYTIKNLRGWLAIYTDIDWQPGIALQYQLACEQLVASNGDVSSEILDWYSLSINGMTGESVEDIQNNIETIDPHNIYPDILIQYTHKHIKNKKPIIILFESAMQLAEQYKDLCKAEKKRNTDLKKAEDELQILKLELEQAKHQNDALLGQLTKAHNQIIEKDNQISTQSTQLTDLQDALNSMKISHSWKLTAPLRFLGLKVKQFREVLHRCFK